MLFHGLHQSTVRCILPLPAHLPFLPSCIPWWETNNHLSLSHCVQLAQLESSLEVLNEIQMSY